MEEAVKETEEEAIKESVEETVKETVFPPLPNWLERWFSSVGWWDAGPSIFKTWKVENELVI
jgi:hypothetical protein